DGLGEEAVLEDAALRHRHDIRAVVLSGGVFQNRLLTETITGRLAAEGIHTWINERVPANDGGISLGQAAIAAAAREG
ncbi:MAG TPA: hypothetical protein VNT60_06385, partial [Deinococcales bacterium]|nr:hypothetical protein [Deinococcales bacterium]